MMLYCQDRINDLTANEILKCTESGFCLLFEKDMVCFKIRDDQENIDTAWGLD